jgi:hypothetical protein
LGVRGWRLVVYVSVDDVVVDGNRFFVDLTVMGFKPAGCVEAVDFLAGLFGRMRFDYTSPRVPARLRKLGYYMAELSRRKIYLGAVPENTYFWTPEWKPSEDDKPVCVFVDTGSPLRHAYIAYHSRGAPGAVSCWLMGGHFHSAEHISVKADFHEGEPACTAPWCVKYLEGIRGKIRSRELHVGVYPAPVSEEHARNLSLIAEALKLAGLTR